MAKGLRASTRKRNSANLRTKVFDPIYNARTERLSAKLQELASKPRPETEKTMDVDQDQDQDQEATAEQDTKLETTEDMDVDGKSKEAHRTGSCRHSGRISKRAYKRKTKNSVVFPALVARQKRLAAGVVKKKK